jgi:hypothetical protein
MKMRESRLFRIGKGGGISILNDYTLDKSLFSEQEQEQMLTALQGMIATTEKTLCSIQGFFVLSPFKFHISKNTWEACRRPVQIPF